MTKTKIERKGRPDRTNSGDVATTESDSRMARTANQGHDAECRDQECPVDKFDMAIRELAYSKWEAAGFPAGDGVDLWLEAEREVKASQQASTSALE